MLRNLKWGVVSGVFLGAVLSIMAGVLVGLRGGLPPEAPDLKVLLGVYPIAGVIGGAIIGLLRPWLTTESRALIVAPVAIFPAVVGFLLITNGGMSTWDGPTWVTAIAGSIMIGLIGGHQLWKVAKFRG
jgi:hypothetical protein